MTFHAGPPASGAGRRASEEGAWKAIFHQTPSFRNLAFVGRARRRHRRRQGPILFLIPISGPDRFTDAHNVRPVGYRPKQSTRGRSDLKPRRVSLCYLSERVHCLVLSLE